MAISVKVARIPGQLQEAMLDDGSTVAQALSACGLTVESGEQLSVNGTACDNTRTLIDGDRVVIVKGAKGN